MADAPARRHRAQPTPDDASPVRPGERGATAVVAPAGEHGVDDEGLLACMLRSIGEGAGSGDQLDSAALGRRLGWTPALTASSLEAAKGRLLIWGIRVGGNPAPCFEDIELTVQGRRFLRRTDT